MQIKIIILQDLNIKKYKIRNLLNYIILLMGQIILLPTTDLNNLTKNSCRYYHWS